MKIIKRIEEVYEFDLEKERKRVNKCFEGEQLQRQLDILDAMFVEENFEKVKELYHNLPYDEEEECAEQEYVGLWLAIFSYGGWGASPIEETSTYEFVK